MSEKNVENKAEQIIILGGLAGILAATAITAPAVISLAFHDEGLGSKIELCPEDVEGSIRVINDEPLHELASSAEENGDLDTSGDIKPILGSIDYADQLGELACNLPTEEGAQSAQYTTLTNDGVAAVGHGNILSGELPDGLVWASDPQS